LHFLWFLKTINYISVEDSGQQSLIN